MTQLPPSTAAGKIIVALDVADIDKARDLVQQLRGVVGVFKIGMELIYTGGLELAKELIAAGEKVFLDAKLLDIGNTVERATAAIARLGVDMLTIHGTDRKTMAAAITGRGDSPMKLLAVTVMTNLDRLDLAEQGIAPELSPKDLVLRRAQMAQDAGFDGVIASAQEAAQLRQAMGNDFLLITPGIRPSRASTDDQTRIMTPAQAIKAGADYLVIGRPIIQAPNPRAAAIAIAAELARTTEK